jgi:Rieske Fe-S protein
LKVATCAVGGGLGLAVVAPVARLVTAPAGLQTVTAPTDPLDVGSVESMRIGGRWKTVPVIAPVVSDAWTSARDVVLGAAFVRRPAADKIEALSAICPHLGCAVGYDAGSDTFLCPCHNSKWSGAGEMLPGGKAKRGLDPLPIDIREGRLRLTWQVYKLDTATREPA